MILSFSAHGSASARLSRCGSAKAPHDNRLAWVAAKPFDESRNSISRVSDASDMCDADAGGDDDVQVCKCAPTCTIMAQQMSNITCVVLHINISRIG